MTILPLFLVFRAALPAGLQLFSLSRVPADQRDFPASLAG